MTGLSLNHGKPVTMAEVTEMKRRYAKGQSINHIASAMGRNWDSVHRYVLDLTWFGTRNPQLSPEQHLEYARNRQRLFRQRQRLGRVP